MMKRELYVLAALLCGVLVDAEYCLPGKTCWPSESTIKALDVTLTGRVVLPSTFPTYFILTRMKNTLVTERPAFVVVPRNVKDVQTAIRFAKKYNIRPTILSSGHSYIGRSTGTDTMMINFSDMKRISSDTKSSTPSITVQPGANWGQVYKEADRVRHLVAGASDRTVAPSGCTLGGCMGPMSRMLGLAADNVLGFTAVTADGRIVTMTTATMGSVEDNSGKVSKEDTSDLFWALRGGGGAFAVVTSITFKLHRPPAGFVHLVCGWQYEVAADFLNHYNTVVGKLPKQWGGKLYLQTPPIGLDRAGVTLSMLHHGAWEAPTLNTIKQLTDFKPDNQYFCRFINYTTFYEYEKTVNEASGFRVLINNRFLTTGDLTTGLTKKLKTWHDVALATKLPTGCTWTHLGGEVKEFSEDSSSVGPDLRKALVSLSCGSAWVDADKDCDAEKFMSAFSRDLHKHGRGSYYNEPGRSQVDFRSEYWGGKYDRLLTIKKKWDPENMFTCDQCVGSSIGEVSAMTCKSPALHGLLGQTIYTFMFAMFATLVGLMGWPQ